MAPEGWVSLVGMAHIEVRADYAGPDNFTGAPLPGYGVADAWLRGEAALALGLAAESLSQWGYTLVVHDAYRPVRATLAMCAWAARLSKDGQDLDFGSPFDHFGTESHTASAQGAAQVNRTMLKKAMEDVGWRNYPKEWWHYSFKMEGASPLDVPYSTAEPEVFIEPIGWDQPGWTGAAESAH